MKKLNILITATLMTGLVGPLSGAVTEKIYGHIDKDGDGTVTTKEFVQHRMQGFVRKDADKDRFLTKEEADNAYFSRRADEDGDGKVSFEEAVRFHSGVALRWDKNKDGILTREEINPNKK